VVESIPLSEEILFRYHLVLKSIGTYFNQNIFRHFNALLDIPPGIQTFVNMSHGGALGKLLERQRENSPLNRKNDRDQILNNPAGRSKS
jgi:hypothetical protein